MNRRIRIALALIAVLAFSASPALAADTGVHGDVTAHIMGQDLPLYSIQIAGGDTITYNVLDGQIVDVGKKGETLDGDVDLIVTNNGTQPIALSAKASDVARYYDGEGNPSATVAFGFSSTAPASQPTAACWQFAARSDTAPYAPGTYEPIATSAVGLGDLSASASKALATKLTLPEMLPEDAPTLYRWTGVVMATASE